MALKPIDFYDAKKWDINEVRGLEDRENKALRIIQESIAGRAQKSILDIGCGNGFFLEELKRAIKRKNVNYFGVDYSKYKVSEAKKMHSDMEFKVCNLEEAIPYGDNTFDVVYSGEVIEHIYDPDHMLEECKRVLKPGGLLIITTPNLNAWYNRVLFLFGVQPIFYETSTRSAKVGAGPLRRIKSQTTPVGHIRIFNKAAIKDLLEAEGFRILSYKGASFQALPAVTQPIDRLFNIVPSLASNLLVVARKS